MYIDHMKVTRGNMYTDMSLLHPDSQTDAMKVNLLLGDNGGGKTSLLQALAIETYPDLRQQCTAITESTFVTDDYPLVLGYGAIRWTRSPEDPEHLQILNLFGGQYGLTPLEMWISTAAECDQVAPLIMALAPEEVRGISFEDGLVLFDTGRGRLPIYELSDSWRAHLAWICDMAYHLKQHNAIDDYQNTSGIVLLDCIELHVHPARHHGLLKQLVTHLPRIQFIVTTNSPLVAGTLPSECIWRVTPEKIERLDQEIQGLDADQILLTSAFGMETTRCADFQDAASELYRRAASGDRDATLELMGLYSGGLHAD